MTPRRTLGGTPPQLSLSRREQQVMDVVYRLGRATAAEVHDRMPDPPTLTAVRTWIRILEEKGHLRHEREGPRHVYTPTTSWATVQKSAVRHMLRSLFDGSTAAVVSTLLEVAERPMTAEERSELTRMIAAARKRGH